MEQQVPATSQPGNASTGAKTSETLSLPGIRKQAKLANKPVSRPRNSARPAETTEPRCLLKAGPSEQEGLGKSLEPVEGRGSQEEEVAVTVGDNSHFTSRPKVIPDTQTTAERPDMCTGMTAFHWDRCYSLVIPDPWEAEAGGQQAGAQPGRVRFTKT